MSRLTDLIAEAKAKDPQMGADLEREARLPFGLNFERHRPEAVELPRTRLGTQNRCNAASAPPQSVQSG